MAKATKKKTAAKKTTKKATKKTTKKSTGKATTKKAAVAKATPQGKFANSSRGQGEDIIQLILEDHKALKQLIETMKDGEAELSERQEAFEEFAPLLVMHSKPEEQTLYVSMKKNEEMREDGFEGDVEHQLADQLLEEIKRTEDEDLWSARVKVLAELVEHHIEEEEEEMLPDFRKETEAEERMQLGQQFLKLKEKLENMGGKDTVEETTAEEAGAEQ